MGDNDSGEISRDTSEALVGSMSPNPLVANYYRERTRRKLLDACDVPDRVKRELEEQGPFCSDDDYQRGAEIVSTAKAQRK